MIYYENEVKKAVKKGTLPKEIFTRFNNAFIAVDTTGDLGLFDIENNDYYVISIEKREEVYRQWE